MAARDRTVRVPRSSEPSPRWLPPATMVALLLFGLAGCQTSKPQVGTEPDTLSDPLGDITTVGDVLYATNHCDAGSPVYLVRLTAGGDVARAYDLELDGVGYLAACSDGEAIYLQVRTTGRIFKVSSTGEILWTWLDPLAGPQRLACGLAYRADVDSFVTLYRDGQTTRYVSMHHGPGFIDQAGAEREYNHSAFDSPTGVLATAWHGECLWALGIDARGQAVVQGLAQDGWMTRIVMLDDPTACGIAVVGGELTVAFEDRRIDLVWSGSDPSGR